MTIIKIISRMATNVINKLQKEIDKMKTNLIEKILENRDEITAIRMNGELYFVDYIDNDIDTEDEGNTLIFAFQIDEDNLHNEYYFTIEDIKKAETFVIYKLQEI